MSDYPYTDDQVETFAKALGCGPSSARRALMHIALAGITVTFPEPAEATGMTDDDCYPYTLHQVNQVVRSLRRHLRSELPDAAATVTNTRVFAFMQRLLVEAGIKLAFPEPRFSAGGVTDVDGTPRWQVRDHDENANVAWFYGHAAEKYAREHAARLNREVPA